MSQRAVRKIVRVTVILLVCIALLFGGIWGYRNWILTRVQVTPAVMAPVVQAFYATGTLLPDREYEIRSSVEGFITRVDVDKGDHVTKGQVLAHVRADDYLMKFRQAQADYDLKLQLADEKTSPTLLELDARLAAANEQLEVSRRESQRINELYQANAATSADQDRATRQLQQDISLTESLKKQRATRLLELQRDLQVAREALDIAQWNVDRQTLTSPIDGVVLDRPVSVGTRLAINDHIMQIADVRHDKLVMRASVDEEDKTRLSLNQKVAITLYAYPGRPFMGTVKTIYPKADEQRRTFEVDVEIQSPDERFSAGMTGELAFIVAEKDSALIVPSQAVMDGHVWVAEHQKVRRVAVEVGIGSVERTEILSGLSEGQKVVITPTSNLSDGQRVNTQDVDPAYAANLNTPVQTSEFKGFR